MLKTGKSNGLAWVIDWGLKVYLFSNTLVTATNLKQVRLAIWKELDGVIVDVNRNYPFGAN